MADISRIVDEVRGFLLSYDQSLTDELAELARRYASACAEANRRLGRCQRLLQQGLRTEAIHLAKEPPDLLDSIQSLDFADRPAWLEVVRLYDLAIPPEFDLTAIEFLHAAYLEDKPLGDLLRLHRRLALQRAPLPKRLQVLRELAEKDPNSPTWAADVQVFEAARVDQIKREAAEAKRLQDVATLGALNDELVAKTWSSPPPKILVRDVAQTLAHLRIVHRRQDQVDLIAQLHDAFAALDVDKARELRRRWRLMDGEGRKGTNPLENEVEPVFLWLDERDREDEEENRYHQALGDLERSLEEAARRDDLVDSREVLLETGRGIPEELERKYRERIEEFSRQSARKLRRIGAAAALVLVVCLVTTLVVWRQQADRENIAKVAAKLVELIDSGQLEEARKYVDAESGMRPSLQAEPSVVEALSRLKSKVDQAARQSEEFEKLYAQASDEPPSAREPEALVKAREYANAEQNQRLDQLWKRRQDDYRNETEQIEAEARPKLVGLAAKVVELDALPKSNDSRAVMSDQFRKVQREFETLKGRADRFGDENRRRYDQVAADLKKIGDDLELRLILTRSEETVTKAMSKLPGEPEGFDQALTDAIKSAPAAPRSKDFERVQAQKPAWSAALALAGLAQGSKLITAGPGGSNDAQKRFGDLERLKPQAPSMPDRKLYEELREYYRAIAIRVHGEENLRGQIVEYLNKPWIGNVNRIVVIKNSVRQVFYTKEPIAGVLKSSIQAMKSYANNGTKPERIDYDVAPPVGELSPQSELANKFKKALDQKGDLENWDEMMLGFMKEIASHQEVDAVLKFVMIKELMRIAMLGSRPFAEGLKPLQSFLEDSGPKQEFLWMDPNNGSATRAREAAEEAAKKLAPIWPVVKERTMIAHRELAERYASIHQPIGWMLKDGDQPYSLITKTVLPQSGELSIVIGTTSPAWEVVGLVKDKKASLLPGKFNKCVEGTIVFVREKKANLGPP